jgi:argininosuccinate synthase
MDPSMKILAPWRLWDLKSREDEIAYAQARRIPVTASKKKPYSEDRNLWHISHEGGILEDPSKECPESVYSLTVSPEKAPAKPAYVSVDFVQGVPVGLNGRKLKPVALVEALNRLGGKHGIGRVDLVENRLVGMKSRGVYETPGGSILVAAHAALESLCLDKETLRLKQQLAIRYADLVYNGQWFTPVKRALDAFVDSTQARVTGSVRLKLFKGNLMAVGRTSPYSLYLEKLATFEEEDVYNQKDAEGFINLFGLPMAVESQVGKRR